MIILTIRTDKPEAELGLFDGNKQLEYITWQAHRRLAETIHLKIAEILKTKKLQIYDLDGVVAFKGPGSFTGLRIGLSVANAFAASLNIPVTSTNGEDWLKIGLDNLADGQNARIALPEYGRYAHITSPKK